MTYEVDFKQLKQELSLYGKTQASLGVEND